MQPNITDNQRGVLEKLNTGWQIGAGAGLDSHLWLQHGGAGCGGKTEKVRRDDLSALVTQRLVYLSKHSFPTSTYDITEAGKAFLAGEWTDEIHERVAKLLDDKGAPIQVMPSEVELAPTKHESYGQISLNHVSGHETPLYGASVGHMHTLRLTISESEIMRGFAGKENYHSGRKLIEVEMTLEQFSRFIFSPNMGGGTPCTIKHIGGKSMASPQISNRRQAISQSFANTIAAVADNMKQLEAEAGRILKSPGPLKADEKKYLLAVMSKLCCDVKSNIPFVENQFQEAMDKTVSEIENDLVARAKQLGLDATQSAIPKLLP